MKAGLGFSRGPVLDNRYVGRPMVCTSHLCHLKRTLPPTQAWRAILTFSATRVLYRTRRAQGRAAPIHLARGGAAVPMPKQAQSHHGAPREYPEKNGPRGLALGRQMGPEPANGPWAGKWALCRQMGPGPANGPRTGKWALGRQMGPGPANGHWAGKWARLCRQMGTGPANGH
jgi:hypothetical protein